MGNTSQNISYEALSEPVQITEVRWSQDVTPMVTVSTITYNHVNYIRNTIDGILNQKTTFPVQILIHDDHSIDGTTEIIREYEKKHSNLITCFYESENTWNKPDRRLLWKPFFSSRRGKYVALCEGDDYWTDPLKLQKQVEFLESNPDVALCVHGGMIQKGDFLTPHRTNKNYSFSVTKFDLIQGNRFLTASICFRMPIWPYLGFSARSPYGDYVMYFEALLKGKIVYLPQNMCVYRVHSNGVWSSNELNALGIIHNLHKNINFYKHLKKDYPFNLLEKVSLHLKLFEQKLLLFKIFRSRRTPIQIGIRIKVLLLIYAIRFLFVFLKTGDRLLKINV